MVIQFVSISKAVGSPDCSDLSTRNQSGDEGGKGSSLFLLALLTPLVVLTSGLRIRAITFLFLAILHLLLLKTKKEKRLGFLIPPLFVLWVNLHGGFLMGLLFLLLWITEFGLRMSLL